MSKAVNQEDGNGLEAFWANSWLLRFTLRYDTVVLFYWPALKKKKNSPRTITFSLSVFLFSFQSYFYPFSRTFSSLVLFSSQSYFFRVVLRFSQSYFFPTQSHRDLQNRVNGYKRQHEAPNSRVSEQRRFFKFGYFWIIVSFRVIFGNQIKTSQTTLLWQVPRKISLSSIGNLWKPSGHFEKTS